ncbi:hypothetical protein BV22DRAFT_1051507 [Leucogyrophana mollusca]|uniref:Uncharacterized protein n=1 Tax=Leucogyrophana mollusca TaxID=85980 RepID=A0ACB8B0Y7_9AGAM|nr:hypothetical protein BV22DRAFT_1051507 [Leucogyrophana mollusca]
MCVGRIALEGGEAADIQAVDEIVGSKGITLSGDGTTHKNANYESRHIMLTTSTGEKVSRAIGVHSAINHTIKGVSMDYAEDQKKFVCLLLDVRSQADRETRGEKALLSLAHEKYKALLDELAGRTMFNAGGVESWRCLSDDEREAHSSMAINDFQLALSNTLMEPEKHHAPSVAKATWETISAAGGLEVWHGLLNGEREVHSSAALHAIHTKIGQKEFDGLSDIEKDATTFFVWAGCFMHKELNAFKGGYTRMSGYWKKHDLPGPAKLLNKDNAAAASTGPSAAKLRAIEVSERGAIKVLSLAGAIFCHKDDKKATVWIIRHRLLISFLGVIKDKKEKRTLTNIKKNVLTGLLDPETNSEMCPLAIYSQIITIPFMQQVRGPTREHTNILDLGPLLVKVIAHCTAIVADPDLVLAPDARYQTATLDGQPFERPEVFYAVQRLIPTLPHIQGLLVEFFQGAKDTWERFSSEFAAGGAIDQATNAQREQVWMKTTNNDNEGTLGTYRISARRAPRMTIDQFNARLRYKRNNTGSYIKNILHSSVDQKLLQKRAREKGSGGRQKKWRLAQAWYDQLVVAKKHEKDRCKQAKKDAADAKVAAVVPRLEVAAIPKMTVGQITLQLQWHRHFDPEVPPNSEIGMLKAGKVKVLEAAIERYNSGKARPCTRVACEVVEESGATDLASESGDGSDHDEF